MSLTPKTLIFRIFISLTTFLYWIAWYSVHTFHVASLMILLLWTSRIVSAPGLDPNTTAVLAGKEMCDGNGRSHISSTKTWERRILVELHSSRDLFISISMVFLSKTTQRAPRSWDEIFLTRSWYVITSREGEVDIWIVFLLVRLSIIPYNPYELRVYKYMNTIIHN